MNTIFSYSFMQRAFLAGVFVAIPCALLGVFIILRKDAMIGHGLAHVTFGGIAIGLFLNIFPIGVALIFAILAALSILKLKEKAGLYEDTAVGILSNTGLALGILLASLAGSFNVDLFSYLFGNILAIQTQEVWFSIILAIVVIVMIILYYPRLLYLTFDMESAHTAGINVSNLDKTLAILVAVTIVLGMKVVGILLVEALIIIPAAAGLQIASNFRQALLASCLVGIGSIIGGLIIAFYLDLPASSCIVFFSLFFLAGLFFIKKVIYKK
ncbi:MAG: metal ABC transporter permease [bacterium]